MITRALTAFAIVIGAAIFAVFVWPLHGWLERERARRGGVNPITEADWEAMDDDDPGTDVDTAE